jgi:DNA polymerase-3 subunit epsilon
LYPSINAPANSKTSAIELARKIIEQKPVYLDTETTGLDRDDEIVELSIVDFDGKLLFTSLVKPSRPIPPEAQRIHHISNNDVSSAPAWPILWPSIRGFLYGRTIAAYNTSFDLRMMQQSHARYRLTWRESLKSIDVLTIYSNYRSVWDPARRSMKFFKLEDAGAYFNIPLMNAHRSEADALLVRAVLHSIAGETY